MQTLYDVLGVPVTATHAEVQRAYRQLLLRFHPDRCYHDNDSSVYNPTAELDEARMRVVEKAHEVLANPQKRRQYDAYLSRQLTSHVSPRQSSHSGQWHSCTPIAVKATCNAPDAMMIMMGPLTSALAASRFSPLPLTPCASPERKEATSTSPSSQSRQQQPKEKAASMTQALRVPAKNLPDGKLGMPIVYSAAISMQRQPDGTVSVRSYETRPRPIHTPAPRPASPGAETPGAASSSSTACLPRRVMVMEEQLSYKGGEGDAEVADEFADAVTAFTSSVASLIASATEA